MKKQVWFSIIALILLALACNLPVAGNEGAFPGPAQSPQGGQPGPVSGSENAPSNNAAGAQVIVVTATPEPTPIPSQPVSVREGLNSLDSYIMRVAIKTFGPTPQDLMEMTVETHYDSAAQARYIHQVSRNSSADNPEVEESVIDTYMIGRVTCGVSDDDYEYEEMTAAQKEMMDLMGEMIDLKPIITNPQYLGEETINGVPSSHFTFQVSGVGATSGSQVITNQGEYWMALDGRYIVKYNLALEVQDNDGKVMHFDVQIEMLQVNQPVTITMPEGCRPE